MKKKSVLIIAITFVLAIGIGGFFFVKIHQKQALKKHLTSATLRVCDYLNERSEPISFTDAEYQALSTAAGCEVSSVSDAMRTQIIRVPIVEKFSALMANQQYDELFDVVCYLNQNDFYFSTSDNQFDIVFAEKDLVNLSAFIIDNSTGTVKTGNTTSYLYEGRTMYFSYDELFCGIQDTNASVLIMFPTEKDWEESYFRSTYCIYVGDKFSRENLVYATSLSLPDNKPSFSDYLKENDPGLYDAIVDRYESLKP